MQLHEPVPSCSPGVFLPFPCATKLELPLDTVKVSAGFSTLYRHLKLVDETVDPDLLGQAMAGKQKRRVFGSNE